MAFKQELAVILEGTFHKKGASSVSRWKQRYFVLYDNGILTYAGSQNSPVINEIDLKNVEYVHEKRKNTNYRIVMKTSKLNKQRIWHFSFETQYMRDLWKHKLMQFVERKQLQHIVNDLTTLDLESVVNDSQDPQDILHLIRRCETDMTLNLNLDLELKTLYGTLCDKFESEENHSKYEAFLDKLGKIDALKHFMTRHKFLVVPLDAIMDREYLNHYYQLIHYDEPHVVKYNTAYLSSSVSCASYPHSSICDLRQIHSMKDIELFAALPKPNDHPSLNSDTYYTVDCPQNQFLFRLLRNHECDTNNEWGAKYRVAYEECTLYELEEYLGLFFYKTIPHFVSSKLKHNKIPIPFRNKIKPYKCKETAESGDSKQNTDPQNETECIRVFDRIISGHDDDFPPNLNMFNVLIFVWILYRSKHCSHIQHPDNVYQKQLKLTIFTKFIHKLCKQFFTAFHIKQHLAKYILTLHYFASDIFDANDTLRVHSQSHMFEMALNAIKDGTCISWKNKRRVMEFLYEHHWIQTYKKKETHIRLYLGNELKRVDIKLNNIYQRLSQNVNFASIGSQIKIVSGNIIFRQDHPCVLSSNWFDAKTLMIKRTFIDEYDCKNARYGTYTDHALFDSKCAHIMLNIAIYLSPRFSQWMRTLFHHHDGIQVFELNVKAKELIDEELASMLNKNIKFPKSASIRDWMRCLIVFPTIEDMLSGYQTIERCSKENSATFRLVHMANGISKTHKRIVDNFRIINIHAIFTHYHPKYGKVTLIGEICFCLESVWEIYGMKKYIIDSYALLLTPHKAYEIAKSLSISKEHPDYDCHIKKLSDIQNKYLCCNLLIH